MKDNDDPYTNLIKSRHALSNNYAGITQAVAEYQEDCERARVKYLASVRDGEALSQLNKSLIVYGKTLGETLSDYTGDLFGAEKDYTLALERYIVDGLKLNVVARV